MPNEVLDPPNPGHSVALVDYEQPNPTLDDSDVAKSTVVDVVDTRDSTSGEERRRAEKAAHRKSLAILTSAVDTLIGLVGASLVAWMTSVTEARAVREWATGERVPQPITRDKLQLALQVATFLEEEGETDVIAAWFRGLNPALDDQSPADLIRVAGGDELSNVGRRILAAAREFVDN